MDSTFLETIFALQMRAMEEPDAVKQDAQALLSECQAQLDAIFQAWEAETGTLDDVESCLGKIKYLNNLVNR